MEQSAPYNYAAARTATDAAGDPTGIIAAYKEEANKLREALQAMAEEKGSSGALEGKYLEQIRKCRTLTVQLESEKTKSRKLEEQLEQERRRPVVDPGPPPALAAGAGLKKIKSGAPAAPSTASPSPAEGGEDTVKSLRDKLDRMYKKTHEKDALLEEMKRENVRMRALVQSEVGTSTDVERLLSAVDANVKDRAVGSAESTPGWVGRAQQITLLKGKVKDMERTLAETRAARDEAQALLDAAGPSRGDGGGVVSVLTGGDDLESLMQLAQQSNDARPLSLPPPATPTSVRDASCATTQPKDVDDSARERVAHMANKRVANVRELEAEVRRGQEALHEERLRHSAAQARVTTVQRDLAQLRAHVETMLDKSEGDDVLIDAYKTELHELRRQLRDQKRMLADAQTQEQYARAVHEGGTQQSRGSGAAAQQQLRAELAAQTQLVAELRQQLTEKTKHRRTDGHFKPIDKTGASMRNAETDVAELLSHWAQQAAGIPVSTAGETLMQDSPLSARVGGLLRVAVETVAQLEALLQEQDDKSTSVLQAYVDAVAELQRVVQRGGDASRSSALLESLPSLEPLVIKENRNLKKRVRMLSTLMEKDSSAQESLRIHQLAELRKHQAQ